MDIFHFDCLKPYLLSKINSQAFPLICPNHQCKKQLSDKDIKEILSIDEYARYEKFQLKIVRDKIPGMTECPNAHCDYMFFKEEDQNPKHICPECKIVYCLKCDIVLEEDHDCEEYKAQ